ncbi:MULTISPECIES: class F sortase [Nocardioides]|uniref:Class F sortase n=1 Tax=Nocardioides vastitatis TaxID=2568655 RepID=A0ABW0ZNE4_9ACTN|nr:class F sortase [Nocardioides sp.]THJ06473.1 class F sortase [Nocardioides sp.]
MSEPAGRLTKLRATLVIGVVLGAALAAAPTAARASTDSTASRPAAARAACPAVTRPFKPTALTIPNVVQRTRVLALGRDRRGVPRTPPLTERGKWQFAWDKATRAGSRYGVVRLNAHTYPGSAGAALGNRLLSRLQVGARIVATGPDGARLCYRVTKRRSVRAERTSAFATYYHDSGPPRLAILVCSGKRRGPGNWSHRTIWWATPVR